MHYFNSAVCLGAMTAGLLGAPALPGCHGAVAAEEKAAAASGAETKMATTLYVAPGGDDKRTGTAAQPLGTLQGARDAVRRLRQGGAHGAVEVLVKPGVYHMAETLVLGPQDSGTTTGPTTYRAAPGGPVVLSGGVPIRGWKQRTDGKWAAPVPAGLDFRLLRVGEKWATRARYPNYDSKNPHTGGWLFADGITPAPAPGQPTTYMRYRGTLPAIADPDGSEIHVFIAWGWVNAIVPVGRIDPAQGRIDFAGKGASQDVRPGNRFFIENVREALDAPGEWFLDKQRNEVLYLPDAPGFPNLPTVAARLDCLIRCVGDAATNRFVEHVRFEGFHFTDTSYSLTDDYYSPQDACIQMSGTRNCEVRHCEFTWCGGYALKLSNRSAACVFAENRLHHLGQGGVIFVGGTATQAHHCTIAANDMDHLGLIYKHVAGVYVASGSDNYIAHNRITDVPRYAISLKSQGEDNLAHRNVVEFNDIRRVNLETSDTGAIESLGYEKRDSGNVIRHNLILDVVGMATTPEGKFESPHFSWGIYMDDFSSGTSIFGNIVARYPTGGVCIHGGQNNIVANNIFIDGRDRQVHLHPESAFMTGNTFVHNIVSYARPQAELFYLFQAWKKNQPGRFSECNYNLYWAGGADLKTLATKNTPNGPFSAWLAAGFDTQSAVADPKFLDAANDDYRLAPDSPAFALGFKAIPVELIGPPGWQQRGRPLEGKLAKEHALAHRRTQLGRVRQAAVEGAKVAVADVVNQDEQSVRTRHGMVLLCPCRSDQSGRGQG